MNPESFVQLSGFITKGGRPLAFCHSFCFPRHDGISLTHRLALVLQFVTRGTHT